MPNHMKNGSSYVAYKATRRRNEIARHRLACARVYGNPADIDGSQAIIDLALDSGTRLAQWLVESLEAQGYDIPDAVRPQMDEAGSADDTPASNVAPASEDQDDPTTKPLPCQAAALLDDPRVEGVAYSGPWVRPQTAVSLGGRRWTEVSEASWFDSEAEAQRRGWKAVSKGQAYLRV